MRYLDDCLIVMETRQNEGKSIMPRDFERKAD